MPTVLQFGDLHLDTTTEVNATRAMEQLLVLAQTQRPDVIVNTGDLAMRRGSLPPWVSARLRQFHVELAKVAPVVVVAGNHDMTYEADRPGTVIGALATAEHGDRIFLAERPTHFEFGDLQFWCVPYPSRYNLETHYDSTVTPFAKREKNEELSARLVELVQAMAADVDRSRIPILVYHGSIAGSSAGDERAMTTELDLVLDEAQVPDVFPVIMCGHIHKPQMIGRAVYAGSPAPLSFSEEQYEHGAVMWKVSRPARHDASTTVTHAPIYFPPAHRLLTLDLRGHDLAAPGDWLNGHKEHVPEAIVRAIVKLPRGTAARPVTQGIEDVLRCWGAHSVKVQVERSEEARDLGSAIRAEARPEELLDEYVKRNPDVEPFAQELCEIAADVEGRLAPEDVAAARGRAYRLLRLSWSNWKSFGSLQSDVNLQELGALTVIEGENASGKSNAAEVEAFALWGKTPRGKVALADLVRIGERKATALAVVEIEGAVYRVMRTISLNSKGLGSAELQVSQLGGSGERDDDLAEGALPRDGVMYWASANQGTAAETQAWLEQLIGPFELYLATRFASQGDIDRLLDMTPAELKSCLQEALGAQAYAARETVAKAIAAEHATKLEQLQGRASALDEQLARTAPLTLELEQVREKEVAAEAAVTERSKDCDRAQETLAEAREAAAAAAEQQKRYDEAKARHDRAHRALELLEGRRWNEQKTLDEGEAERGTVELLTNLREQRAGLSGIKAEGEAARAAEQGCAREHAAAVTLRDTERRSISAQIAAAMQTSTSIDREIEQLTARTGKIATVPFAEKCAEARCALLTDAVEARETLPDVSKRRAEAAKAFKMLLDAQEAIELKHAGLLAKLEIEWAAAKERLAAAIDLWKFAAGPLDDQIHALELTGAEVKLKRADAARAVLAKLEEDLAPASAEFTAAKVALATITPPAADVAARVATLQAAHDFVKHALDEAVCALENLEATRHRLEGQLEASDAAKQQRLDLDGLIAQTARASHAAQLYVRAVGRDGIPLMLFELAIPALEAHANAFLGDDAGLRLELEPERALQSGERRSDFVLRYRNGFGSHPMSAASGFERVAIGYALRAALAQVQAESHGVRVTHWIADEGWGAFDDKNLLLGQQMLRRLAEEFSQVLFISHVGAIREIADSALRVVADPANGSRLEVAR